MRTLFILYLFLLGNTFLLAQNRVFAPEHPEVVDGLTPKSILEDRMVLSYPDVQERDILWERRVWREIDTREKMNLPFRYQQAHLVKILMDEVRRGNLTAYSSEDDQFAHPLTWAELHPNLYREDTISLIDPDSYETTFETILNELHPEDIHKLRLKEVWWVDSKYGTLRVRILGIAPVKAIYNEDGSFRHDQPLFWIHYPSARPVLAKHEVYHGGSDQLVLSWEDWFEIRFFKGSITKVSNIHGRALEDYLSEKEQLQAAALLEQEIFNYEHDLWSY